ncbi:MAG: di-heme oxidoredictase family protein [Pseudomonadota bacterium]|nr:di-heme oxidoredictase family protein [Pseudomonadota bacterium]
MKVIYGLGLLLALAACSEQNAVPNKLQSEPDEALSAGQATGFRVTAGAFSEASSNISFERKGDFLIGNDFFEDPWVIAPSSTKIRDGLGPLFNVSSCQSCHVNDGRGHAPDDGGTNFASLLIRSSRSKLSDEQLAQMEAGLLAHVGDSKVGGQLQDRSIPGVPAEISTRVTYITKTITLSDNETVELRQPIWHLTNHYGEFDEDTILSVRVAPPMIGLGLLEQIDEADIFALADPDDQNQDGISGRANMVWDVEASQVRLGRFGLKAGQPTVRQQVAAAFNGDLGLTTSLFPKEGCEPNQIECLSMPTGKGPGEAYEIRDDVLDFVTFYSRNLAVPIRRNVDLPAVLRGRAIFNDIGCASCHVAQFTTTHSDEHIEQSEQVIRPYTDLLLHDMGEELADVSVNNEAQQFQLVEFKANAREWRTAPLWGIGLTHIVDDEASFLHDGRARTILEAVLWHGGEAEASKQQVVDMSAAEREDLLAFLYSL